MENCREKLHQLKSLIRHGDMGRLAKVAGVSAPTLRSALRKESADELTIKEVTAIERCLLDETLRDRQNKINWINRKISTI